ncbi:MAG: acetate--CoA ligase family protein [Bacillota bacterium]
MANLSEADVYALLEGAGIKVAPYRLVRTADEAARAADEFGYPVVCKVASADIMHKSKLGGVVVDLGSAAQVREAFDGIIARVGRAVPKARIDGCLICGQVPRGLAEAIVGTTRDAEFGRVVMFGVGGEFAEVIKAVDFRSHPVGAGEAAAMARKVQGRMKASAGWSRVAPTVPAELVRRFSELLSGHPEVESIDINPAVLYEDRYIVIDAKGTLAAN